MSKQYLVTLQGGDTIRFIVGQAGWDYINQDYPNFPPGKFSVDEKVPDDCVLEMDKKKVKEYRAFGVEYLPEICTVTTGSWDNDRALHLSGLYKNYDRYPRGKTFEDEYNGCIY